MNAEATNLSVVVITYNEEGNLPRCLASLPQGSEIIVFDSGSSDQTEAVVRSFGGYFHFRKFDDYAQQKNAAIAAATRPWIFSIDADEEMDESLRHSLRRISSGQSDEPVKLAYKVRRKLVFLGCEMRFGKTSDDPVRLFQRGACQFVEPIHEYLDVPVRDVGGPIGGRLGHHSYANIEEYFNKFNTYTSRIAHNHFHKGVSVPAPMIRALRPFFEFLSRYFFRLGFLDGRAGFAYALFSSLYAYVKYEKLAELYCAEKAGDKDQK